MMTKLLAAIQFLTILPLPPIKASHRAGADEIGRSSAFFPLAGLLQGLLLWLLFALSNRLFPRDVVAGLVVAALVFINGGFHLDGLADTVDALASRQSRDRMLAIMKESTSGPIGVVAIVLTILLKYLLLKNAFALPALTPLALVLAPAAARWSMVPALYHGASARNDGLGKTFIDQTGIAELATATAFLAAIAAAVFVATERPLAPLKLAAIFLLLYLFSFAATRLFAKRFGGLTGDSLGAVTETAEVLFLLLLGAFSAGRI